MLHLPAHWLWLEWLGVLVMPFTCACLVRLQLAANVASGDPEATTNRRFTLFNMAWIVVGVVATAWALVETARQDGAI